MTTIPKIGNAALVAGVIPSLGVSIYWLLFESIDQLAIVFLASIIFCFGYTFFVVLPLFLVLGKFLVLSQVQCILIGALLALAPTLLVATNSETLNEILVIVVPFGALGMLSGYLFFRLKMPITHESTERTHARSEARDI